MSDYKKIDKNTMVLRGVRFAKNLPEDRNGIYKALGIQLKRGKNVWSKHSRVVIPKTKFEALREDFKKVKDWTGAVPEPGDLGSLRGPKNLHAHEYKNFVVLHRDKHEPKGFVKTVKHLATEGLAAIPKGIFGKKIVKEASIVDGIFFSLTKTSAKIPIGNERSVDLSLSPEEGDRIARDNWYRGAGFAVAAVPAAAAAVGLGGLGTAYLTEALAGEKAKSQSKALLEKYTPHLKHETESLWDMLTGKGPRMMMDEGVLPITEEARASASLVEGGPKVPKRSIVSSLVEPTKIFHTKSPAFTAHEIGHVMDAENIARNTAVKGPYMRYFAELQNEFRASKNAYKILEKELGTLKAIKSIPALAGGFSTYVTGSMPTSLKALTIGLPLGIAGVLGAKHLLRNVEQEIDENA